MFANVLRVQARSVLASRPVRASALNIVARLAVLRPTHAVLALRRPLSTSNVVRSDFSASGEATRQQPRNEPTSTLYVGNLPFNCEEQDIREPFTPFGQINSIRIGYNADGRARGFAHIEFANKEDAIAAVESMREEPLYIMDRDIRIDYAPMRTPFKVEPYHKLFFQDFYGEEAMIREAAKDFESSMLSVFFLKDIDGQRTGKGFIDFMSTARATAALESLNGAALEDGSKLNLKFARPPKPRNDTGYSQGRQASHGGDWQGGSRNGGRGGYGGGRGGSGGRQGGYEGRGGEGRGRGDGNGAWDN